MTLEPGKYDALLLVDVQRDFCPGGALPVPEGDAVVPILNHWLEQARFRKIPVYTSQDWHPANHCSFKARGGPWPPHCVQGTPGAELHAQLKLPDDAQKILKGARPDRDDYSAFDGTGLADQLKKNKIRRLWIGGLAREVCVRATALAGVQAGFEVHVLIPATRALEDRGSRRALQEMAAAGAVLENGFGPSPHGKDFFPPSALLTDLYQLTMLQSYWEHQMNEPAVFDLFARTLPKEWKFFLAGGLEQALAYLENLHFTNEDLSYLKGLKKFKPGFLEFLDTWRFQGDVFAVPEGTMVFPGEPILEVRAPMLQAQLVETYLIQQVNLQTALMSKASRVVLAARGRKVVDFGARRAQGSEAALLSARCAFAAGVEATSDVLAAKIYGIPPAGTMAHSFVQAHASEVEAFRHFLESFGEGILLVDTYDTLDGVKNVVRFSREIPTHWKIKGVRLDSGDLLELSREARKILDQGGLREVEIFASGGLDEYEIDRLLQAHAPIDGFGVGSKMTVSADAPYLDTAYKLVEYAGEGSRKLSEGKATLPGAKQVFRLLEKEKIRGDCLALAGESCEGQPLLDQVMCGGRRTFPRDPTLEQIRRRVSSNLTRWDAHFFPYPVRLSPGLSRQV